MADKSTEKIKYETEVLKLITFFTLAIGGGSIGLLLGKPTPFRLILAVAGLFVTIVFMAVGWQQHRWIRSLIDQIKESI